jgi:anti-anti-sigma regulatory factor
MRLTPESMFKIQRWADGKSVIFTLSGRLKAERLGELEKLLECEGRDHSLILDLREVKLVDRHTVSFLASCEAKGVNIENCPAYIREWIEKEAAQSEES